MVLLNARVVLRLVWVVICVCVLLMFEGLIQPWVLYQEEGSGYSFPDFTWSYGPSLVIGNVKYSHLEQQNLQSLNGRPFSPFWLYQDGEEMRNALVAQEQLSEAKRQLRDIIKECNHAARVALGMGVVALAMTFVSLNILTIVLIGPVSTGARLPLRILESLSLFIAFVLELTALIAFTAYSPSVDEFTQWRKLSIDSHSTTSRKVDNSSLEIGFILALIETILLGLSLLVFNICFAGVM